MLRKTTKLTNSSDETTITSLISGDSIFTIPYFQRPYKWKSANIKQLNEDIGKIVDNMDSQEGWSKQLRFIHKIYNKFKQFESNESLFSDEPATFKKQMEI